MSTKGLTSILFSRTRGLVLRELVLATGEPTHLRELARRTGLDPSGILRELRNLSDAGIVLVHSVGNQKLFRLNRRCPVHDELRMIVLKTGGLADGLRSALRPLAARIEKAYVYGSIASGTDNSDSDIDLMVIGDVSLRDCVRAVSKIGLMLGRVINPVVVRPAEFRRKIADPDGFLQQVESAPKIMLIGDDDEPR